VFGNIADPNSRVTALKASARNYSLLDELNTKPRTTYLAAVRNPHPSLPHHVSVGGHETDHDSEAGAQPRDH
jgi:molybdopterin-containing oxidoreductase family iron-sulfur binding subunit